MNPRGACTPKAFQGLLQLSLVSAAIGLALVNEGLQNGQIAERLVLSVRTVNHHVEAVLHKLGAETRARLEPSPPRPG